MIVYNTFLTRYIPTVFDNETSPMVIDGLTINLELWDTAGQEGYARIRPLAYNTVRYWIHEIRCLIFLDYNIMYLKDTYHYFDVIYLFYSRLIYLWHVLILQIKIRYQISKNFGHLNLEVIARYQSINNQ